MARLEAQVVRLAVPAATVATVVEPRAAVEVAIAAGVVGVDQIRRRIRRRRFDRAYVRPTLAAIRPPLGGVPVRLHVDPSLGTLTLRLAKPLSPAEKYVRRIYGARVEPVLRWPVDRVMRIVWLAQRKARPATKHMAVFRRPGEEKPPRIELFVGTPFLTGDQVKLVSTIVKAKIPVSDLGETWDQIGPDVTATWIVRKRPPENVGYAEVIAGMAQLDEWEFFLGLGAGGKPVTISLRDDSPHVALSAGSGAGKSILAQLVAVQILARGGKVTIIDRKGSHRWALGLPGVDYCTTPPQMHNALVKLAELADERNTLAMHEPEGWVPGPRHLVIVEELNATISQLVNFWATVRDKSDPKRSPAVTAIGEILFMGRSALVNMLAIAQMLSARAIGGPEARENFGVRCLARFSTNAWKMLVPEAAQPRTSRILGRWQIVTGGVATECQVGYLTAAEARAIACPVPVDAEDPEGAPSSNAPDDRGQSALLTLRQASEMGVIPWRHPTAKKRLQRAVTPPPKRGKSGTADLYQQSDLIAWAESERVS